MVGVTLQAVGALVVLAVTVLAAVAGGILLLVFSLRRRRRRRHREEAARRALEEMSPLSLGGILGLAAGTESVRLAAMAVTVGTELAKQGLAPVLAGSLRRLAEMAEADRPAIKRAIADDGTVTLMFSDIEDSTSLNERLGDEDWLELLREHDGIVRRHVRAGRGQVVKTQGDSFMVAFKEVPAAVACAVEVQRALDEAGLGGEVPVRVRIGIHHGEVTKQGRDLFGLNVALAARVADCAAGGEILASAAVRKHAREGVRYGSARRVKLKGISTEETVYPVDWRRPAADG